MTVLLCDGTIGYGYIGSPVEPLGQTAGVLGIDFEVCDVDGTYRDPFDALSGLLGRIFEIQFGPAPGTATMLATNPPPSIPVTVTAGDNDVFVLAGTPYRMPPGTYTTVDDLAAAMAAALDPSSSPLSALVDVTNDGGSIRLTELAPGFETTPITGIQAGLAGSALTLPVVVDSTHDTFRFNTIAFVVPHGTYTTGDDVAAAVALAFNGTYGFFGSYVTTTNLAGTLKMQRQTFNLLLLAAGATNDVLARLGFAAGGIGEDTSPVDLLGFVTAQTFSGAGGEDSLVYDAGSGAWINELAGATEIPPLTTGPHTIEVKFDFAAGTWIYRFDGTEYDHSADLTAAVPDYASLTLSAIVAIGSYAGLASSRNRVFVSAVRLGTGDYGSDDVIAEDFSGDLSGWGDAFNATIVAGVTCSGIGPAAVATGASAIGETVATLEGTVNPDDANDPGGGYSYFAVFDYGPTGAYGTTSDPIPVAPSTSSAPLSLPLTGLTAGAPLHFRIRLLDSDGSTELAESDDEEIETTAAAGGVWTVEHRSHAEFMPDGLDGDITDDGADELLEEIYPENLHFRLQLGTLGPGTVDYEVSRGAKDVDGDPAVTEDFVGPMRTDFVLKRSDLIEPIMAGMHTTVAGTDEQATPLDVVKVTGADWLEYLDRRRWPYDAALSYVDWPDGFRFRVAAAEIGQLVKDILETVRDVSTNYPAAPDAGHPSYSLAYTVDADDTGHTTNYEIVQFESSSILDLITTLATAGRDRGGFDLQATWDKVYRIIYPEIGDPDSPVFTIEVDVVSHLANAQAVGFTNTGPAATHLLGVGAGTSTRQGGVNRHFRHSSATFRRLDDVADFAEVKNLDALEDLTGSQLALGSNPVHEIPIRVDPATITDFWLLCKPGVYVAVNYDLGFHTINSVQRVTAMDCNVSTEGDESVDLELNQYYDTSPDAGLADF